MIGLGTIIIAHQFVGSANHGWVETCVTANLLDPTAQGRIRDVLEIPRQQIVYTIDRCNRDMKCVAGLRCRNGVTSNQGRSQRIHFVGRSDEVSLLDHIKSLSCRCSVTI